MSRLTNKELHIVDDMNKALSFTSFVRGQTPLLSAICFK